MDCAVCRDALSARLDGEDPGVAAPDLDHHLARCPSCRRFGDDISEVHRLLRVRAADPVPDLTGAILAGASLVGPSAPATDAADPDPRVGPAVGWVRYGLFVIGLTLLVLAVPALVLHDTGDTIHLTRELSAWDLAFGAGLVFVAWRPSRARGLLPMAVVLAAGQLLGSVIDVTSGRSPVLGEAHHAIELVGVLLLWALCRMLERRAPAEPGHPGVGLRAA